MEGDPDGFYCLSLLSPLRPDVRIATGGALMARARNIKPGFFDDEELAALGPYAMILFAGLWTLADREGRLEDRPQRIKARVLPYFDVDVDDLLSGLQARGFIVRYTVDDGHYIQVTNFRKHQSPHVHEAASTIQAPDGYGASTGHAPDTPDLARARSDSGFRIPDSLIADCGLPHALPREHPRGSKTGSPPREAGRRRRASAEDFAALAGVELRHEQR